MSIGDEDASTVLGKTTRVEPGLTEEVAAPGLPRPGRNSADAAGSNSPSQGPWIAADYQIERLLGRGGMGEVLLARDPWLGRPVALKRILPGRSQEQAVRSRFIAEARITAMLQHPSILPVYHFSENGQEIFYTMRPVEGRSLAELIRRVAENPAEGCREWTVAHLVRLFLQAASAVAFAHSRGVIHCDLKPANIMIGPFEEVVVLDWGVAALLAEEKAVHRGAPAGTNSVLIDASGALRPVVGTLRYMAPELLEGGHPSAQTDIFALGVILYELLALQPPWDGRSIEGLLRERQPPLSPIHIQPFRDIPHRIVDVVNRALDRSPSLRYATVEAFAHDVADATEGRGTWVSEQRTPQPWAWRRIGGEGRTTRSGEGTILRSTGRRNTFRFFLEGQYNGNLRVSFEMNPAKGRHHLAVVLSGGHEAEPWPDRGYSLTVLAGNAATVSLLRNGRDVAGAANPQPAAGAWHRVVVQRTDNRVSLMINDHEVYAYVDPIPLTAARLGLAGRSSSGVHIRNLQVASGGVTATVSCLAVPDAFFNRQLYDVAQQEYHRIAQSLVGRLEGRIAAFRACLCAVESARGEPDPELRAVRLEEFQSVFEEVAGRDRSCLFELGRALLASERQQRGRERALLHGALTRYPEDPQRSVVQEWILARLHSAATSDRLTIAYLAPLAIEFCTEGSGKGLVRELTRRIRQDWEMPPLMESRLHEGFDDLTAQVEALLFFGFWSAQPSLIKDSILSLVPSGHLEPKHVADGLFGLLELDSPELAADVLRLAHDHLEPTAKLAPSFLAACRCSILAAQGQLTAASEVFATLVPDPADRVFNGTRLRLARAHFAAGASAWALQTLRPLSVEDTFAREHRAWFHLLARDAEAAREELAPLINQGNHRRARDMSNFLYCAALVRERKDYQARQTAEWLPPTEYPRSWTLGSYYLAGRLGNGNIQEYLTRALPWERRQLCQHLALLARCRQDEDGYASWTRRAAEPLAHRDPRDAT